MPNSSSFSGGVNDHRGRGGEGNPLLSLIKINKRATAVTSVVSFPLSLLLPRYLGEDADGSRKSLIPVCQVQKKKQHRRRWYTLVQK